MYIPCLKARIFTISSSPSSFHSTRPLSVETLWVAMVMVSITKSQSVKSICHATKPDGEPGSRARYTWSKMDQISSPPWLLYRTALNVSSETLVTQKGNYFLLTSAIALRVNHYYEYTFCNFFWRIWDSQCWATGSNMFLITRRFLRNCHNIIITYWQEIFWNFFKSL